MSGTELLAVETVGLPARPGTPTFVLLHGFGASRFSWRTWAPALGRRGHVVLVDLKGFGAAAHPDDGRYAPADHAELVLGLIRERDLTDLVLVGHSMGGAVALLTAMELLDTEPERLSSLVLVAGAGLPQRLPPFVRLARWPRLCETCMRLVGARIIVRVVLRTVIHDPTIITDDQVEGYAAPLDSPEARRALMTCASMIIPDDVDQIVARYPDLHVPTLLLWGRQDRVVPLAVGEQLADVLPDARLEILEACGHVPAEEYPELSLRCLEAFLDGEPLVTPAGRAGTSAAG